MTQYWSFDVRNSKVGPRTSITSVPVPEEICWNMRLFAASNSIVDNPHSRSNKNFSSTVFNERWPRFIHGDLCALTHSERHQRHGLRAYDVEVSGAQAVPFWRTGRAHRVPVAMGKFWARLPNAAPWLT